MTLESIQKEPWKDNLWIRDESAGASIVEREREIFIPDKIFEKVAERILTKEIKSKISVLEKQVQNLKKDNFTINVSYQAAKEILRDTIQQFKDNKIEEIDVIDLHSKTRLPIQQIGDIMIKFEDEGVVTEYGES